jgi:hypothetical protein
MGKDLQMGASRSGAVNEAAVGVIGDVASQAIPTGRILRPLPGPVRRVIRRLEKIDNPFTCCIRILGHVCHRIRRILTQQRVPTNDRAVVERFHPVVHVRRPQPSPTNAWKHVMHHSMNQFSACKSLTALLTCRATSFRGADFGERGENVLRRAEEPQETIGATVTHVHHIGGPAFFQTQLAAKELRT